MYLSGSNLAHLRQISWVIFSLTFLSQVNGVENAYGYLPTYVKIKGDDFRSEQGGSIYKKFMSYEMKNSPGSISHLKSEIMRPLAKRAMGNTLNMLFHGFRCFVEHTMLYSKK